MSQRNEVASREARQPERHRDARAGYRGFYYDHEGDAPIAREIADLVTARLIGNFRVAFQR